MNVCLCFDDTADVAHEDNGNYTCEVRAPEAIILGHVTHRLLVRGTVCVTPVCFVRLVWLVIVLHALLDWLAFLITHRLIVRGTMRHTYIILYTSYDSLVFLLKLSLVRFVRLVWFVIVSLTSEYSTFCSLNTNEQDMKI